MSSRNKGVPKNDDSRKRRFIGKGGGASEPKMAMEGVGGIRNPGRTQKDKDRDRQGAKEGTGDI